MWNLLQRRPRLSPCTRKTRADARVHGTRFRPPGQAHAHLPERHVHLPVTEWRDGGHPPQPGAGPRTRCSLRRHHQHRRIRNLQTHALRRSHQCRCGDWGRLDKGVHLADCRPAAAGLGPQWGQHFVPKRPSNHYEGSWCRINRGEKDARTGCIHHQARRKAQGRALAAHLWPRVKLRHRH